MPLDKTDHKVYHRLVADSDPRRDLPSVHELAEQLRATFARLPRGVIVEEVRRVLAQIRMRIENDANRDRDVDAAVRTALAALERTSLRPVINATGVVLHTNLGRAPLGPQTIYPGYTNLEYDLITGKRGKRDVHIAPLLERLCSRPGIAVNNNAAAIYLALHELAAGGEVIVSRGELIEIGDGFRIPDIMSQSGAVLREVGTTNRTYIRDYKEAINERTRLLLRIHPSNFRVQGFTARPVLQELVELGRENRIAVYEDLGSGCLVDLRPFSVNEPIVSESLRNGADLVSFSADKLLGGPQAGILVGNPELVARLRRNPMFRALRIDKSISQILESVLRAILFERWDCIPILWMIRQTAAEIRSRAERLLHQTAGIRAELVSGFSVLGGGSTPEQPIATCLIRLNRDATATERTLRNCDPPIITRIDDGRVVLDLRTVLPEEEKALADALQALSW